MVNKSKQRPAGWLGTLYDEISSYSDNPLSELEAIANQALNDGNLPERIYHILQQRIPFSGFEWESRAKIGENIGVVEERVRQFEEKAYQRLEEYLPIPSNQEELDNLNINRLPWKRLRGENGIGARGRLINGLSQEDGTLIVRDVVEFFNGVVDGKRSLQETYCRQVLLGVVHDVFQNVNISLPQVTVQLSQISGTYNP